jgi:hypothetical protein
MACYDGIEMFHVEEILMTAKLKRFTRSTGVTLEIPVLNYLRYLAEKADRDRSFCINEIVREHAQRNGRALPPATQPPDRKRRVYEER